MNIQWLDKQPVHAKIIDDIIEDTSIIPDLVKLIENHNLRKASGMKVYDHQLIEVTIGNPPQRDEYTVSINSIRDRIGSYGELRKRGR